MVEIKYCRDSDPSGQLSKAQKQHAQLSHILSTQHGSTTTILPILLGVSGAIYREHTYQALLSLGLTKASVKQTIRQLHTHAIRSLTSIASIRRKTEKSAPPAAGQQPTPATIGYSAMNNRQYHRHAGQPHPHAREIQAFAKPTPATFTDHGQATTRPRPSYRGPPPSRFGKRQALAQPATLISDHGQAPAKPAPIVFDHG